MASAQLGLTIVALIGVLYVAMTVRSLARRQRADVHRLRRRGAGTRAELRELRRSLEFVHVSLELLALLLLRRGANRSGETEHAERDG